ncbi:PREDICTED: mitochondrial import inner membrane translocase subunit Tim8 [Rhagoletis zephyria]|uniref:mitochondrial import inner membrane translocase subunit Tim8 n=1 Tax=Rhagoletis zephyria TaxID=28612 RepID=UPI0008116BEB|nr:PREDICTED: mitochondrial import inner membrane translocase subunit Tim8 [Rhagoletis zephyria]XP_036317966.1 mitochondrial import inner membrane translocase subunit Tim8 [Rhagoletis pomonella]
MSDFDSLSSVSTDKELQEFLMIEKQKAQVNAQIHEFNDICWEKCIGKPGSKLDSSTETCLSNCVDRFIDTSLLVTQRFAQLLQKRSGGL